MKIKMILSFLSVGSVIFLSGCASAPQTGCSPKMVWHQSGISAEQTKRDLAECQYAALVNGRSYSPIPAKTAGQAIFPGMIASSSENSRENQIIQTCMTAKGYSLVNSNSPVLNLIPVANMTAEQLRNATDKIRAKAESGDADAQYQLGSCYCIGDLGVTTNYTEAIKWYQKAADQNYPNIQRHLAAAYARRAVQEQSENDLDGALADLNKASEVKPDCTEIYIFRAYVKQCQGDLDGALVDYKKARELNPSGLLYAMGGLLNYNLHRFTDSLVDSRKACELNVDAKIQDYSRCYIWLVRARLGEQPAATKELQAYLDNRKSGTASDWAPNIARLLVGQLTEPNFFIAAENLDQQIKKKQYCEAYFFAGSKRLIEGDKTTATDYFKKSMATECKDIDEYNSAAAELKFLEKSN